MESQIMADYKNRLLAEGKAKNTIRSYLRVYKMFYEWLEATEGCFDPNLVTVQLLQEYKHYLRRTGLEDNSITTHMKILSKEFNIVVSRPVKNDFEGLPEVLLEFHSWLNRKGYADNTIKSYVDKMSGFIRWFKQKTGKEFSPSVLTDYDVLQYRRELQNDENSKGKKNKPAGINSRLFAISKFCAFCVETKKINSNPLAGIVDLSLPLSQQPVAKWLNKNEQYKYIREVREAGNKRDHAIVLLFIDCGPRLSELTGLKTEDVILYPESEARIRIYYSKQQKSREVPIESKRLRQALLDYIKIAKPQQGEYFFNISGKKMSDSTVQKMIAKYADRARLKVTPHTLRHCFAKNLFDENPAMTLQEAAMVLGHFKRNGKPNIDAVLIYVTPSMDDIRTKMRTGK